MTLMPSIHGAVAAVKSGWRVTGAETGIEVIRFLRSSMSSRDSITHYRTTANLGKGETAEVWRASDTKPNRDVAIKILPDVFASDAEPQSSHRIEETGLVDTRGETEIGEACAAAGVRPRRAPREIG